jgi:hypothetical protein
MSCGSTVFSIEDRLFEHKTSLEPFDCLTVKTLHLHFIHQFAVKSVPGLSASACCPGGRFKPFGAVGDLVMTAKVDRTGHGNAACRAVAGLVAALMLLVAPPASAAEALKVVLDQATILKLPEGTSTIVVGNPLIADVSIQAGGLAIVTGKGYGSTNLVALDRSGSTLLERDLQVRAGGENTVFVYRGVERESYACAPICERRITLGDSPAYFSATAGQTDLRNNQAAGAAKPPGAK